MATASSLALRVVASLKYQANPEKAALQAKYFKNVCKFHGLISEQVRTVAKAHTAEAAQLLMSGGRSAVHDMAKTLLSSTFHEEKDVAVLLLQSTLDKKPNKLDIGDLSFLEKDIFDEGHAYDWGIVDSLCGKVIHHVLVNDGNHSNSPASLALQEWSKDSGRLWKQRASCVGYVKLARHGNHDDAIINVVTSAIRNPERFVQLGCGWVLRELYLADPQRTVDFIIENYEYFSREGLRYATEKMNASLRNQLLKYDVSQPARIMAVSNTTKRRAPPEMVADEQQPTPKRPKLAEI